MRSLCLFALSAAAIFGQLPAPNEAGVSMGHIHLLVKDPDAQKKLWTDIFGVQPNKAGMLPIPGIYIIAGKAQMDPTGGSDGSTVNHIGLLVKDFADIKAKMLAAKVPVVLDNDAGQQMIVTFPEGVRVEINGDASISAPVAMHHIHLSVLDPEGLRAWYVKTFGATPGSRRNLPAAMIPGGEVDFLKARTAPEPTKGRSLDHIGFEVKGLEAFCKKLEADGIKLDSPYREVGNAGLHIAFFTDPVGTRIELTEGLGK